MICHPRAPSTFLPVRAYFSREKRWCEVGCMVPTCANATLVPCPDSHDLVVLGGDARDHLHYSNKVFRLSLKDARYARRVRNGRGSNCKVTFESNCRILIIKTAELPLNLELHTWNHCRPSRHDYSLNESLSPLSQPNSTYQLLICNNFSS